MTWGILRYPLGVVAILSQLFVKEVDGTPNVNATTLEFPNGTLTDQGGGVVGVLSLTGGPAGGVLAGTYPNPTFAVDMATQAELDAMVQGLSWKDSARAATTANITLSGTQTVDGVSLIAADRVVVKNQTSGAQNGLYAVAAGAWSRTTDASTGPELVGAAVLITEGTSGQNTLWTQTVDTITLDTTPLTWVQIGQGTMPTAGGGLTLTSQTLDVVAADGSITVNADSITVGLATVAKGGTGQTTAKAARETGLGAVGYYSSATHSAGTTITVPQATHLLRATQGLIVQLHDAAAGTVEYADVAVSAGGDVTVTFSASQAANAIRVTVIG